MCSCIVWIPQIVKLIRTRNQGSLSLAMFLVQAPGNLIIIIFQAVLSHQDWSTWISYLVMFIEQGTIVVILIVLKCKYNVDVKGHFFDRDGDNPIDESDTYEGLFVPDTMGGGQEETEGLLKKELKVVVEP